MPDNIGISYTPPWHRAPLPPDAEPTPAAPDIEPENPAPDIEPENPVSYRQELYVPPVPAPRFVQPDIETGETKKPAAATGCGGGSPPCSSFIATLTLRIGGVTVAMISGFVTATFPWGSAGSIACLTMTGIGAAAFLGGLAWAHVDSDDD